GHRRLVSDWSSDVCSSDLPGTTSLQTNLDAVKMIGPTTAANIAHYNAQERINGHGVRRWFRALHIITTFALYQLFIYVYHRGWRSEERRVGKECRYRWAGG